MKYKIKKNHVVDSGTDSVKVFHHFTFIHILYDRYILAIQFIK